MKWLFRLLLSAAGVLLWARILPGVVIEDYLTALVVVVVMAIVNAVLKPVLVLLTLPITLLTLGLFLIVLNVLLTLLVAWLVPGFEIQGFWYALLFGLLVAITQSAIEQVLAD
ncbi:MAG: hypothetical protein CVV27_03510 [Candidatus Melainabacteria bacterium HGW-Melainabacteria-1]|nr:MAG: hypothetical protein CVV27_03510 [Candidatus Melainabacteria bacterium HGW-Melainabacteria-1]